MGGFLPKHAMGLLMSSKPEQTPVSKSATEPVIQVEGVEVLSDLPKADSPFVAKF